MVTISNGTARQDVTGSIDVEDGTWHHVAVVWDRDANTSIYVDGVLDIATATSYSGTDIQGSDDVYIGDKQSGSTQGLTGTLDEIRIWNTTLTSANIRDNMCKTLTGSETNLVGYWNLDDGSGTTVDDLTSNDNDGTFVSGHEPSWVTSGAAIGDASIFDYSSPTSVNLVSGDGDDVTINSLSGSPDGVQVYRVDSAPNITTPPAGIGQLSQSHYFGVFIVGGASPTYTITYDYDGHPGIVNENNLELANRDNNADGTWTDLDATINTTNNTLIKTGETGSEYILGSISDNSLPVELTSFSASVEKGYVLLEWITESEIENLGFILERRMDDLDWKVIANYIDHPDLQGQGSVTGRTEYRYVDNTVDVGKAYSYRLADISYGGVKEYHSLTVMGVEVTELPVEFALHQNYPNPFNPNTMISFDVPMETEYATSLRVYNIKGQLVETLVNEQMQPGPHKIKWNPVNIPSGIYIVQMRAGDKTFNQKLTFIK